MIEGAMNTPLPTEGQQAAVLVLIIFIALVLGISAWALNELVLKPRRQMDGFAKGLARIKRETTEYGGDFRPVAIAAAAIIERR